MFRVFLLALLLLAGCGSAVPNRLPLGETFPSVSGTALSGQPWQLPQDLDGEPTILLIGYKQNTQFDIDRWLIGFEMGGVTSRILEVPTIKGLVPGLISGKIDEGMRGGIPEPLWKIVVTVYGDAPKIVAFTGNENPNNARVLVLDAAGSVVYFHDAGFSAVDLARLLALVQTGPPRIPGWVPSRPEGS